MPLTRQAWGAAQTQRKQFILYFHPALWMQVEGISSVSEASACVPFVAWHKLSVFCSPRRIKKLFTLSTSRKKKRVILHVSLFSLTAKWIPLKPKCDEMGILHLGLLTRWAMPTAILCTYYGIDVPLIFLLSGNLSGCQLRPPEPSQGHHTVGHMAFRRHLLIIGRAYNEEHNGQ